MRTHGASDVDPPGVGPYWDGLALHQQHFFPNGPSLALSSSSGSSAEYSDSYSMAVTSQSPTETPPAVAANVCAACRSRKRKCNKSLPTCSRCAKMKIECNYTWDVAEPQPTHHTSLSDFLLFHVPVTSDQLWLPGTFQALQPYQQNINSRGLDIDRFFVGAAMTTLTEQGETLSSIMEVYFQHIHPWLPIIHEQTFRAQVSQLEYTPVAETALLFFTILLLMREHDQQIRIYPLCRYLFSFVQLVRSPSLVVVQAGILLSVYELGAGHSHAASLSIGTCARLGYVLRLNMDKRQTPQDLSWTTAEEQRRVWMGVYMLDRLIHQVTANNIHAPHAVEEPSSQYNLPADDRTWNHPEHRQEFFQPSFSTPIDVPLSYFAREIQATRMLGQVQTLHKITNPDLFKQQAENIDTVGIHFMQQLFEQTPRRWEILCGANAIALMATITLHRTRLDFATEIQQQPEVYHYHLKERSVFALCSIINMVRDICIKFNAIDARTKIAWVPLPALICTGEAVRAAGWLNRSVLDRSACLDVEPMRTILEYSGRSWGLAKEYDSECGQ
ncbi:fungal-specific transcription factor domain-containing protein [Aspergillus cavernicola]|uniref:Fungal-specific transcription factor domain-containing protein n=1 Tax=Aspergillus cavernicola TaxID=176166 RepID=A0ABR4I948_9EURO